MNNREFLQLADNYENQHVGGWFLSEKLDGMRCFWDGGLTRGLPVELVPFANLEKSGYGHICTGLWSRYGNVIHAPDWWLDLLPMVALDGELYCGRGQFQRVMSICRTGPENRVDNLWKDVIFNVFDAPTLTNVFSEGRINNTNYKKIFDLGVISWVKHRLNVVPVHQTSVMSYVDIQKFLNNRIGLGNMILKVHKQSQLSRDQVIAKYELEKSLDMVLEGGGEGLIVRDSFYSIYFNF